MNQKTLESIFYDYFTEEELQNYELHICKQDGTIIHFKDNYYTDVYEDHVCIHDKNNHYFIDNDLINSIYYKKKEKKLIDKLFKIIGKDD